MSMAVVIQARMGSSRFPGKVLRPLGGGTVISTIIRRCRAISGCDVVCCAIPEGREEDPLETEARRAGAEVLRGARDDVLARFAAAARHLDASLVMRITGDKPLIDPRICGQLIELRAESGADFACNNMPESWPHGLDCEVFTADALYRADAEATAEEDREHVTPWMRRHDSIRRVNLSGPGGDCVKLRWTLDYPEDFAFLEAVFEKLPAKPEIPLFEDVMAVLEKHPEIPEINAKWSHLSRYAMLRNAASPDVRK